MAKPSTEPKSGAWLPLRPSEPTSEQEPPPLQSKARLPKLPPIETDSPKRILDFDIETRRIGFHSAGKFSPDGCEPVVIAASWSDEDEVHAWTLTEHGPATMLRAFRRMWDDAGVATGHYIRPFDLPIINGAMIENGLPPLPPRLTSDTHKDFVKVAGLSKSQENLSLMAGLTASKFHMADYNWREVARLGKDAITECVERCTKDVRQHKQLREWAVKAGALKGPRPWAP